MADDGQSYQKLLFDSTLIIALVTSILYLLGYLYYVAFFSGLLIPYGSIDLSISQCIMASILPLANLIVASMVFLIFDSPKFKNKFEKKKVRWWSLLILICLAIILLYEWTILTSSYMMLKILILIFVLMFLLLIIYIDPQEIIPCIIAGITFTIFYFTSDASTDVVPSMLMLMAKLFIVIWILIAVLRRIESTERKILSHIGEISDTKKIFVLIFIIVALCFFSNFVGAFNAHYMVEGSSPDALKINISLKDTNNTLLENKTLILVMLRDDHYYIIEEDRNRTKKPKLHIIPSDQIKMLTVYEKGKGPITDLITN